MKNVLIATNFTPNAEVAGKYGYALAAQLKANAVLLNSFLMAEETPQGNMIGWPLEDYELLQDESHQLLNTYKQKLEDGIPENSSPPVTTTVSQMGNIADVILKVIPLYQVGLAVIGTHYGNVFDTLITGNHCKQIIDSINCPLLIVPPGNHYQPIKKIAFASAFENPANDLHAIYQLINFARPLNAEILLVHIYQTGLASVSDAAMKEMLNELTAKANYPAIYYRLVKQDDVSAGLDWLCGHGHIDILAMLHYQHSWPGRLFKASYTQKMARKLNLPLMVFATR